MTDNTANEEYTSFSEYLEKTYPRGESDPLDLGNFKSVGSRMAHESLELLRRLLSDSKISCEKQ